MPVLIKICGLNTLHSLQASLKAGADMIGLVFHPKSPRYVPVNLAADLADEARGRAKIVALICDADDKTIQQIDDMVEPDFYQLHGKETPARVAEIKAKFKRPIIKAIGVSTPADLASIAQYAGICDYVLLDAKPPTGAAYPGGHGLTFDLKAIEKLDAKQAFILSGGLTLESVAAAIKTVRGMGRNIIGVDVSSGVEGAKQGQKSLEKIDAFIKAARKVG
jgi:phosphoribosylanthranilate isomerase